MRDFFLKLFSSDFMPHGHCYFWRPEIVWLHVISDATITLAYYSIPVALWYFMRRRRDLMFTGVFGCFAAFIFACGTTHAFQIWTLWHGTYRLEGVIKAITGVLSISTAVLLAAIVPRALRLPTTKQLEDANRALAQQIGEREQAEAEVRILNLELERRVEERTAALKRSNQELAEFAYVASHDLQEPLRMVTSYTQLLKLRYANKLDANADVYIDFAVNGASRMQSLIQDLLAFSRVDHAEFRLVPVRVDSGLDQSLAVLQVPLQETGARIVREPLPEVLGDEGQLAQVFQNLIGNSLKYRSPEVPQIHIGVKEEPDTWVLFVKDNGIGFDPAFAEQIFGVFKRLHGSDCPGNGIGLAIARKIIGQHGGRIWSESSGSGRGATFYFTLPKLDGKKPNGKSAWPARAKQTESHQR